MRNFVDILMGISLALFVGCIAAACWVILIIAVLEYVGGV